MERIGTESDESCESCRFWQKGEGTDLGECHRYAPAPFPLSVLKLKEMWAKAPNHDATWPTTADMDWCGDWEYKMRKLGSGMDLS